MAATRLNTQTPAKGERWLHPQLRGVANVWRVSSVGPVWITFTCTIPGLSPTKVRKEALADSGWYRPMPHSFPRGFSLRDRDGVRHQPLRDNDESAWWTPIACGGGISLPGHQESEPVDCPDCLYAMTFTR